MKRKNIPKPPFSVALNPDGKLSGMCSDWLWNDLARIFGKHRVAPVAGFEVTPNGITVHYNDILDVHDSMDYRAKILS